MASAWGVSWGSAFGGVFGQVAPVSPPEELRLFASGAAGGGPDAQVTLSEWRRRHRHRHGGQHQIHAPGATDALHDASTTATHPRRRRQRMEDDLLLLGLLQ